MQKSVSVINSAAVAHALLDRRTRSAIYSCRLHVPMAGDVCQFKMTSILVPYGETFSPHRKYLQHFQTITTYHKMKQNEAHRLLNDILDDLDNYKLHIERMAGSIIMEIVFGHEVKSNDDFFLQVASKGGRTIAAAGAVGAHIVDLILPLRFLPNWLPGTGFKRLPRGTRETLTAMRNVPFNDVKRRMAEGNARHCYITDLLEDTKHQDEEGVRDTGANVYSGDVMIALVIDPVIQARAQAELDIVTARNRLPEFSDRRHLPYIQCIISEAFRCVPHRLTRDDTYNGLFLPAGSTVIANSWAMLHDPTVYPELEKFSPDRFLMAEGHTPQPDPRNVAFGFGHRACPGMEIAENTIWITIVSMFFAFKITPGFDATGKAIPIDSKHTEHSVRHPKPLKCTIRPRAVNSAVLVKLAAQD
ncbi:cytochrome P450 [Gautieria morchelliformis]|nr:cytochrome P450 [Gautieria morchelliformis]